MIDLFVCRVSHCVMLFVSLLLCVLMYLPCKKFIVIQKAQNQISILKTIHLLDTTHVHRVML